MEYILKTYNLVKQYKKHKALNQVNMNIAKGDIYGFVGENGSGKTTIIRLITGLIFPNSGSYELFGISNQDSKIIDVRKKVGAIVETPSIYNNMSAFENLKMQGEILGVKDENKIIEVLKEVGLENVINDKKQAGNFSLGMRQRLGIAMALLGEPEFLILDEPMNGLDPAGIVEIRELILKLNQTKNITFLISSHILTELALVATKYGIISKGKIIKEITFEELKKECQKCLYIKVNEPLKLIEILSSMENIDDVKFVEDGAKIYGEIDINEVLNKVLNANIKILNINTSETNIEEYYLNLLRGGKHE